MGMAASGDREGFDHGPGEPLPWRIQAVRMMTMPMAVKPMNWVRCLAAFPTAGPALRTSGMVAAWKMRVVRWPGISVIS